MDAGDDHSVSALVLKTLYGRATLAEAARRAGFSEAELAARRQAHLDSKLPLANQTVPGRVSRPVRILRDAGWVPHVYAENSRDLFFGQGFAMAQDRLWQMDYLRRHALGRLAEILGEAGLATDPQSRILGFGRSAQLEHDGVSSEAGEALAGFTDGVNAWMERVWSNLPIEFELLEYEPEPWNPRDSLAILRAYYWHLTGRLDNLAAGEAARLFLPAAEAAAFLRTEFPDETILPATVGERQRSAPAATGGDDTAGGSNNWAVAPDRSESGRAMLATDPHVPFSLPGGYYQSHLAGGGYNVAGAGNAGAPGIKFGHNDCVAWGITNLVASPRDIYIESLHPDDPGQYRDEGSWHRLEVRIEEIAVRGALPVTLEVRTTTRGPLVDGLVPKVRESDSEALSLRWVGHERLNDVQATLDLDRARDWKSFRRAVSAWRLPIFNLVYADADGHIGWQAVGAVPVRGGGDLSRGFRPANDDAHTWQGCIPFEDLPRMADPPRGWIGTANNRPLSADAGPPLYGWWAPGQRAARLRQLLERLTRASRDDFHAMHFDAYSVRAELLVPMLRQLLTNENDAACARVAELLAAWDYQYRPDSTAATVFETFFELWVERVIRARFPAHVQPFLITLGAGSGLASRLITEFQTGGWFRGETVGANARETARETLTELAARLGEDSTRWRWGAVHRVSFRHPLDSIFPDSDLFATEPREAHGTSHVLNNNGYPHGKRFEVGSGPEFRMVVDFADLDATETVLTTGQSGQPGSPHYLEMLEPWLLGRYFRVPFSPSAVEAAKVDDSRIEPVH